MRLDYRKHKKTRLLQKHKLMRNIAKEIYIEAYKQSKIYGYGIINRTELETKIQQEVDKFRKTKYTPLESLCS